MAKGTTSDSFLIARAMDSAVYLRNDPCKLCSLATVGYLACARAFLIQKPFKMYSPVSFSPAQVCEVDTGVAVGIFDDSREVSTGSSACKAVGLMAFGSEMKLRDRR
jgi:hypothetical protein